MRRCPGLINFMQCLQGKRIFTQSRCLFCLFGLEAELVLISPWTEPHFRVPWATGVLCRASHIHVFPTHPSCPRSHDFYEMRQHSHCCFSEWNNDLLLLKLLLYCDRLGQPQDREGAAAQMPPSRPCRKRRSVPWCCKEPWRSWHSVEQPSFMQHHQALE